MPKSQKPWLLSRVYDTIEGAGLLLGMVSTTAAVPQRPPITALEKETYSAELYKRRRRLKEIRAGFKRFLAFLFSQIGLSLLVIGYTIIGGMIFRAVELENEKTVKIKGKELRTALADQFSGEIIRELRHQISSLSTWQGKYYTPMPMKGRQTEVLPRVERMRQGRSVGGRKEGEFARLRQWLHVIAYTLRHKTRQELHSSLRKLVKMMDHEGWNGEDTMDDLKWSWEGSILFAVTVITTIGYGHAVPKTNAGKVLTIIYALVGIPLVFLYLTNIGDYLATLFRTLYAKICRRRCESSCINKTEQRKKMRILNALKAQPSEIDLTQRRDFLLDESLHRNNINIIRRIGSFGMAKKVKEVKEEETVDCLDINAFFNEHLRRRDQGAQHRQEDHGGIQDVDTSPRSNHRPGPEAIAVLSRSSSFNNANFKSECLKGDSRPTPPVPSTSYRNVSLRNIQEFSSTVNSPNEVLTAFADTIAIQTPPKPVKGRTLANSAYTVNSILSLHNVSTQTILQAGPDDVLTNRSLCKSFITGHYLRSYRREQRHQRMQMQRMLKKPAQLGAVLCKGGCNADKMGWTLDNKGSFLKTPFSLPAADDANACSLFQDLIKTAKGKSHSFSAKCMSPNLTEKSRHQCAVANGDSVALFSVALPAKAEPQNADALGVSDDTATVTPEFPINPLLKSRLSVNSSPATSSNDLMFRLSYYSNESICRVDSTSQQRSVDIDDFDGEDMSNVTVPISLSIMIMTTYILIGAIVFCIWEDRNYLKWSYFCFVTLSTIGFGDIVPGTKIDSTNPQEKLIIITVYVAVGLSVFAMCFKLMQEEVVSKCKWFARYMGVLKRRVRKHRVETSHQVAEVANGRIMLS